MKVPIFKDAPVFEGICYVLHILTFGNYIITIPYLLGFILIILIYFLICF